MNVLEIEKLNQLISRTDMSGNEKVEWLVEFIEGTKLEQKQAKEKEINSKLRNQLFIGKVSEIIGENKTIELLIECRNVIKQQ